MYHILPFIFLCLWQYSYISFLIHLKINFLNKPFSVSVLCPSILCYQRKESYWSSNFLSFFFNLNGSIRKQEWNNVSGIWLTVISIFHSILLRVVFETDIRARHTQKFCQINFLSSQNKGLRVGQDQVLQGILKCLNPHKIQKS